jgi:alkylation response protein AidB-like acyl-CoA dehydrogenase
MVLEPAFTQWLDQNAKILDTNIPASDTLLKRLASHGLLHLAVPSTSGKPNGDIGDVFESIAAVATHSLTAAFVLWGQRVFIELLLQSDNVALKKRLLPDLLAGRLAGATGLSNTMKFLSGIEALRVQASRLETGWSLEGELPWVTNLNPGGFVVAAAAQCLQSDAIPVFAIASHTAGVIRSPDLELMGLQASHTASLELKAVHMQPSELIHADARQYLPTVRPAFLGMQCGLASGLARKALMEADNARTSGKSGLGDQITSCRERLDKAIHAVKEGLKSGYFRQAPAQQFELRIRLTELAIEAVQLELSSKGGNAYRDSGFARRWWEAAFLPILTPSLLQLKAQLQQLRQS